jgi:hypothetical protein
MAAKAGELGKAPPEVGHAGEREPLDVVPWHGARAERSADRDTVLADDHGGPRHAPERKPMRSPRPAAPSVLRPRPSQRRRGSSPSRRRRRWPGRRPARRAPRCGAAAPACETWRARSAALPARRTRDGGRARPHELLQQRRSAQRDTRRRRADAEEPLLPLVREQLMVAEALRVLGQQHLEEGFCPHEPGGGDQPRERLGEREAEMATLLGRAWWMLMSADLMPRSRRTQPTTVPTAAPHSLLDRRL